MDSIATKPRKRSKFFPCFRPAVSKRAVAAERPSDDPAFAAGERGVVFTGVIPVALSSGGDEENIVRRKKKDGGSGCVFSRALRAVLLETSLAKKIIKRKQKQKSDSANRNSRKENQRFEALSSHKSTNYNTSSSSRISAPFTSSSFGSSCSSSSDANNKPLLPYTTISKPIRRQRKLSKMKRAESGWVLLVICLLCLVFWGKVCAIMCTLAWILFVLRRRVGFRSPAGMASESETDSRQCKKIVVIEGFLARDRSAARGSGLHIH